MHASVIVTCDTLKQAERLAIVMREHNITCQLLRGELPPHNVGVRIFGVASAAGLVEISELVSEWEQVCT